MVFTLIASLVLIGLDQLSKWLVVQYLLPAGSTTLIPGLLGFRYVENTGAAFNILRDKQLFLIIITSVALAAVLVYILWKKPANKLEYFSLIMIFAGGVGNLIDRIANGYVVDFIEVLLFRFAVFNVADCFVCVGFVLLFIAVLRSEIKASKAKKAAKARGTDGED